jgi:hypothetical protein
MKQWNRPDRRSEAEPKSTGSQQRQSQEPEDVAFAGPMNEQSTTQEEEKQHRKRKTNRNRTQHGPGRGLANKPKLSEQQPYVNRTERHTRIQHRAMGQSDTRRASSAVNFARCGKAASVKAEHERTESAFRPGRPLAKTSMHSGVILLFISNDTSSRSGHDWTSDRTAARSKALIPLAFRTRSLAQG